jgi:hypothetical protein
LLSHKNECRELITISVQQTVRVCLGSNLILDAAT